MLIRKVTSIEKTSFGYCVHADAADVMLVFMTPDIIRIRVSFQKTFPEASYALVTTAWPDLLDDLLKGERVRIEPLDIACEEDEKSLAFDTGRVRLIVNREPFFVSLFDSEGACIYSDLPQRAFEQDHLGRPAHYSLLNRTADHFYGFGEKTGHLDKAGRRMRMSPKDAIGHDPEFGEPLYKHIPFYVRINEQKRYAVGLFYNSSYDCVFDMGNEISGYWSPYVYYQTEGPDIDLFLLNGPTIKDVLERYTFLTGRSAMPTKKSIGYSASTMYYAELERDCDQKILGVTDQYERMGLGIDNFWLGSGYSSGEQDNLRYVFNWNLKRFPCPERFIRKMSEKGVDVVPNLKPGILEKHPYRHLFERASAFIRTSDGTQDYVGRWWGGPGRFVDFTNPEGRRIWKRLLQENIFEKGVTAVWNDNCEYDGIEDRDAQCSFEGMGGTMAQLKIIHSNMMAYTAREALAESYPGERPYIISRAGYAGIQRYAQVWGGDNLTGWRTLKFNIATILGMGLSGVANTGCDIGGFAGGAPEAELLLRWIQNGIFQPRFCMNSANDDNTVTQPWMYGELAEEVRAAYRLRYRMLPYLYSLLYEAHKNGLPVWRPLFLEFPDDVTCYANDDFSFLFGAGVLVANVVEKDASVRSVYLPAGCGWYDMNDNMKRYEGGQRIEVSVERGSIPMFLRGNGIFLLDAEQHTRSGEWTSVDFIVAAEDNSTLRIYDDDGHSMEYEQGQFCLTTLSVTAGESVVMKFSTEGERPNRIRNFRLKLMSKEKGACQVWVDDVALTQFLIKDEWEQSQSGWYFELSDRTVCIKHQWPQKKEFTVTVSRKKFDLIGMAQTE